MDFTDKYLTQAELISNGILPVGSVIKGYVRSTGQRSDDSSAITSAFYTSLTTALAACTSDRQHVIIVLPGHSEAVGTAMFTNAPTGVSIVGAGRVDQDDAPTFLWSVNSSNWAVAAKNTMIANCRLIANADGVTEAITVTAAGFKLINCHVDGGVTNVADFTSFLNFSTGADNGLVIGNEMRATAASNGLATFVKGGTAVDNLRIIANKIIGLSTSTTVGAVHISAACTNLVIANNYIDNQVASGTAAMSFADVASTGFVSGNYLGALLDNASPNTKGIVLAGTTNILVHFHQNFFDDGVKGSSGILSPAVTS